MKKTLPLLGVASLALLALTGCTTDVPAHAALCADRTTNTRVADTTCEHPATATPGTTQATTPHLYGWYYVLISRSMPAVGQPVTGGSYKVPKTGEVVNDISKSGGKVPQSTQEQYTEHQGPLVPAEGEGGHAGGVSGGEHAPVVEPHAPVIEPHIAVK